MSAVTDRGWELVLPQVIAEAGPAAVGRYLEFFAGRIANKEDVGVREGRGAVSRVVRGARTSASNRSPRSTLPPARADEADDQELGRPYGHYCPRC